MQNCHNAVLPKGKVLYVLAPELINKWLEDESDSEIIVSDNSKRDLRDE